MTNGKWIDLFLPTADCRLFTAHLAHGGPNRRRYSVDLIKAFTISDLM